MKASPALDEITREISAHTKDMILPDFVVVEPNTWTKGYDEMVDWCRRNGVPGPIVDPRFSERDARPHYMVKGVPIVPSIPEG